MEARIKYQIRGIFMLNEKTIPPLLMKHLTNKMFNKPNKEAMEQVLYYLLPLIVPNCLKNAPWPITTLKEAAEFRNAVTQIINGLNGFIYEKSTNVVGKVNSSLLANPGGKIFIFFMYQLCSFISYCELKKKGIDILNTPLYIEDMYIDNKIAMFGEISKSNFNEVNQIISQIDYVLQNTSELTIKYKEIIQETKLLIKDLKSELLTIEHCEATENDVAELKKIYFHLYDNFKQKKLIAIKCAKLADIILNTPKIWDANMISLITNIDKEMLMGNNGKLDLVILLTTTKNSLKDFFRRCEQLNNEEEMNDKLQKTEQLYNHKTEQLKCYEQIIKNLSSSIDNLEIENKEFEQKIFNGKNLKNIDPRLLSVYKNVSPIILKTDLTDTPLKVPEGSKKSRRSILLHSTSKPYSYQSVSIGEIKDVYKSITNQSETHTQNDTVYEKDFEQSSFDLNSTNQVTLLLNNEDENFKNETCATTKNQALLTNHTIEDEVNSVRISRRSIENIKQTFSRIKKQGMSTIPHSPLSES